MELHRLYRKFTVPHSHDDSVFRFRRDFQAFRESLALRVERMVASDAKWRRQPLKNAPSGMDNRRTFAVHRIRKHFQHAAKRLYDALQPQAHAEHRDGAFGKLADEIGYAEIFGPPWPGRNEDDIGPLRIDHIERYIGAESGYARTGLPRIIGERV